MIYLCGKVSQATFVGCIGFGGKYQTSSVVENGNKPSLVGCLTLFLKTYTHAHNRERHQLDFLIRWQAHETLPARTFIVFHLPSLYLYLFVLDDRLKLVCVRAIRKGSFACVGTKLYVLLCFASWRCWLLVVDAVGCYSTKEGSWTCSRRESANGTARLYEKLTRLFSMLLTFGTSIFLFRKRSSSVRDPCRIFLEVLESSDRTK